MFSYPIHCSMSTTEATKKALVSRNEGTGNEIFFLESAYTNYRLFAFLAGIHLPIIIAINIFRVTTL